MNDQNPKREEILRKIREGPIKVREQDKENMKIENMFSKTNVKKAIKQSQKDLMI